MENNEQTKSAAAEREEAVLKFWEEEHVFEKTLAKESPKGEFVFYEGPPTANGKPGIHHLEGRAFKDAIPRYKTMRGFHVRRKGGWDTHGLPVELQVEKKLGLSSKKAIEEYGIAKFNEECKESVWEYRDIWEKFTTRIGYWVDQKDPYVTYHNSYIESLWNVLSEVEKKDLLYKDYKVVPWCPRCGTALSSHELAQGYEDVKDLSVYAKFKVAGKENTYFLAWTTTPWTLPGNVALAVGRDIEYVVVQHAGTATTTTDENYKPPTLEKLILSKDIFVKEDKKVNPTDPQSKKYYFGDLDNYYEIIAEHKGSEMVGMAYEPLYPFLKDNFPESEKAKLDKAFKVHTADFVTTTDGTGIVHTAVMYGQDDFELGTKVGLPKYHLVNEDGTFKPEAGSFAGHFVKDEDVAVDVIKDLAGRGLLFKKEKYEHSYPHCWRCKTPLIYYARDSWYIRMSSLRDKLVEENKSINWEPSHIRNGRFGEWLKDLKDWAISRERYWGTPLPIWETADRNERIVVDSIDTLKKYAKSSGNTYFVLRHGQAENNVSAETIANSSPCSLTAEGREQVAKSAEAFSEKVDVVISSPYVRTRETAHIFCEKTGFPFDQIVFDDRIREWEISSEFHGKPREIMTQYYHHDFVGEPEKHFADGESFADLVKRAGEFIYDIETKYQGKKILIIAHSGSIRALSFVAQGGMFSEMAYRPELNNPPQNAEMRTIAFAPLPHNSAYELDLHRPFIDDVVLLKDGKEYRRVKEVMDVWFDSGAMPFAQDHYPFGSASLTTGDQEILYPADFIAEGIDQTRGWFYTLHAVGMLMGRGKAYRNVICLGHILDAQGKKMSKSLGNVIDPWVMMDKYGVDTLRLWMYSVNQPGDSKNFDEKTVAELHNKVFNLLYNVVSFYELYRDTSLEAKPAQSSNVLDAWIMARLGELTETITTNLDAFKLFEPVREIRAFIDDLSTWYVRRSRDRMKDGDSEAKQTLYAVLKQLVTIMAPFAPFAAEDLWQKLKNENDTESVHLAKWPVLSEAEGPEAAGFSEEEIARMQEVRTVVSLGLEARQKSGFKVRQPLASITVGTEFSSDYQTIIADELNVKEVKFVSGMTGVALDTTITPELKAEGDARELMRAIQDMRKKADLSLGDEITLTIETDDAGKALIEQFAAEIKKTVLAKEIVFAANDGVEIKVDSLSFKISIKV